MKFKLKSNFKPKGSQPEAIRLLVDGLKNKKAQTLLGVTGSGKTFTIANVIATANKPVLVIAHNKTLAAQLYEEFKEFFPENRIEYFVSYYDYYQPESYIPSTDQYIEKDSAINPKIDQMRLAATQSVLSRNDTIIIASVSCIYGLGNPDNYLGFRFGLEVGQKITRTEIILKLLDSMYERNDTEIAAGRFRVKGNVIDFIPNDLNNIIRLELSGNTIEKISELDKISGDKIEDYRHFTVYPSKHFMVPEEQIEAAIKSIEKELKESLGKLSMLEAHRLKQRTQHDIEMIREIGTCKGIENYSLHFDGRKKGAKPFCLLDYFPKDFLIIIDESHQTIPQISGMYKGDKARKKNLIDFGFRLESAYDNRPLKFEEFEEYLKKNSAIFVSATPGFYEHENSTNVVEQIIRPTGLVDPEVFIHPIKGQMQNILKEIKETIKRGDRILLTTLTKKLAEELTDYLAEQNIKTRYLHSEIKTLERSEIIRELRLGKFDVLVGINLLREGLDIPEIGFIGILDADKEGFLRDEKSLIQTIGRAARNAKSKVVLYADKETESIKSALRETNRRRAIQIEFNKEHKIKPRTISKPVKEKKTEVQDTKHISKKDIPNLIVELTKEMETSAEKLDFERAIFLRDKIKALEKRIQD